MLIGIKQMEQNKLEKGIVVDSDKPESPKNSTSSAVRSEKLVVVIMGQNCEKFIKMCLDSVKDADAIVYLDGGSKDKTLDKVMATGFIPGLTEHGRGFNRVNLDSGGKYALTHTWDPEDKEMNGKQRNYYLNFIKENFPDWWCLVLDADELIEDLSKVKEFIQTRKPGLYNVKMRHFIGDLGHEDATRAVHVVPRRLFKISEAKQYPLQSHPVLNVTKTELGEVMGACLSTCIWHLGHLPIEYMDYILKRYKEHSYDSIMHSPEFLTKWRISHLFGHYPKREINPLELPKQLCDRCEINKDEFYFMNRQTVESKHFFMMRNWLNYSDAKTILDIGCGFGLYGIAARTINPNIEYTGVEISKYVGDNWNANLGILINEDIKAVSINKQFDLVLFVDVLEHLTYENLDIVLKNECNRDSKFIFSIPFEGDPNLEADSTHIIKEDKQWWINKLSEYFKISEAPQNWLFSNQILIGEIK